MRIGLKEFLKIMKGINALLSDYFFQVRSEEKHRLWGHQHMLGNMRAGLYVKHCSFLHRIESVWNYLPTAMIEADSLKTFKNRIDECFKRIELI